MKAGAPNAWRPSILSELGRFRNDETLRSFALALCEMRPRPKTKEAVSMLRRVRLGSQTLQGSSRPAHEGDAAERSP
jgi:hypothetical protein